jgi:glycosyltransferase involved in cell wall biosynthesis
MNTKKTIRIIIGRFLPNYLDGGPIKTIFNLTFFLHKKINFKIVTSPFERGSKATNPKISKINEWLKETYYDIIFLKNGVFSLKQLMKNVFMFNDDVYLCGLYSPYTFLSLLIYFFTRKKIKVYIAPMGDLNPKLIKIKSFKKNLYLFILSLFGLTKKVMWSCSNEEEETFVKKYFPSAKTIVASDIPSHSLNKYSIKSKTVFSPIKIVFFSRIIENKNLLYAIDLISKLNPVQYSFHIYGDTPDLNYWNKCKQQLVNKSINYKYYGPYNSLELSEFLVDKHFFIFPTFGENFGHVVFEALSYGVVPIMTNLPHFKSLFDSKSGFSIEIQNFEYSVGVLKKALSLNLKNYLFYSENAYKQYKKMYCDIIRNSGYLKLL